MDCRLLIALFVWIPYGLLVTASMLIFNVSAVLVLASYIILKKRNPEKPWLYGAIERAVHFPYCWAATAV